MENRGQPLGRCTACSSDGERNAHGGEAVGEPYPGIDRAGHGTDVGRRSVDAHDPTGSCAPGRRGGTMAFSHLAPTLYLVLGLAFVALISTIIWGYTSLSNGVTTRRQNGLGLRVLARMPGYLAVLAVGLVIVSIVIEPHRFTSHGKVWIPLNGYPGRHTSSGLPRWWLFASAGSCRSSCCRQWLTVPSSHWHRCAWADW